jgi:thiol-disulfide isomerase/thioredoxin
MDAKAARRTALIVLAVLVPTGLIGFALAKRLTGEASRSPGPAAISPGSGITLEFSDKPVALPPLALTDLDGHAVPSDSWRGKVVLINFWATWCGPCREEIPALIELQEHYRDRLVVAGLSIDTRSIDDVRQFMGQYHVNYVVAMADEALQRAFGGISAVPATFVVNPDGGIVQRHIGLINPVIIEHEIRSLSGMTTDAAVRLVKDTGQVLLANAAYATEIPGVDLSVLTPPQKEAALKQLNTDHCTCGCNLTLAQCRINDPKCTISPGLAKRVVEQIRR